MEHGKRTKWRMGNRLLNPGKQFVRRPAFASGTTPWERTVCSLLHWYPPDGTVLQDASGTMRRHAAAAGPEEEKKKRVDVSRGAAWHPTVDMIFAQYKGID